MSRYERILWKTIANVHYCLVCTEDTCNYMITDHLDKSKADVFTQLESDLSTTRRYSSDVLYNCGEQQLNMSANDDVFTSITKRKDGRKLANKSMRTLLKKPFPLCPHFLSPLSLSLFFSLSSLTFQSKLFRQIWGREDIRSICCPTLQTETKNREKIVSHILHYSVVDSTLDPPGGWTV